MEIMSATVQYNTLGNVFILRKRPVKYSSHFLNWFNTKKIYDKMKPVYKTRGMMQTFKQLCLFLLITKECLYEQECSRE